MQWSNLTKCGLFVNIVSLAIHTLLPSVLQRSDSRGIKVLILSLEKVLNCRMIWPHHRSDTVIAFSQVLLFVHVGGQKTVRWYQIRRIWRVINHFKATVTYNTQYCNHRLVCRSIVLVKTGLPSSVFQAVLKFLQYYFWKSLITYSVWAYLEGNNAVSIRKCWI